MAGDEHAPALGIRSRPAFILGSSESLAAMVQSKKLSRESAASVLGEIRRASRSPLRQTGRGANSY